MTSVLGSRKFLAKTFPLAFSPKGMPKKPLKIGISSDIMGRIELRNKYRIFAAIRDYCSGPSYFSACTAGAMRIDLDGNPCGFVTVDQAIHATEQLATFPECIREKWKQCA